MLLPAVRGATAVARNPQVIARLTNPIKNLMAKFGPRAQKATDKAGLGQGLLVGAVASVGVDQAIEAVMEDPDTARNEASALIQHMDDDEARDALIELVDELASLGVEGIPFNELPPEVATDLIKDTDQSGIYGLPGAVRVPSVDERRAEARMNKAYASVRKIHSVDQILGLFMLIDIAGQDNRLETLDYLEENFQSRRFL